MITKLANAIGYPDRVPSEAVVYAFRIDGEEYIAEKMGARLIVRYWLNIDEEELPKFAGFSAGRMLREEAVFAWDDRSERACLWQEMPMGGSVATIVAAFEAFLDACEWWQDRVNELHVPPTVFPDIMIKP